MGPLARLLLRTESIASWKVEGLQVDARDLARGEARADTGGKLNPTTAEVLANIDAMERAIDESSSADAFGRDEIVAIHRQLMTAAPNARIAGRIRTLQNWIGGNDHNPCGADVVPPISVVFARGRDRYIETFATAAIQATDLAASYLDEVAQLTERWRAMLRATTNPRADAAAWAIIDVLPAYRVVTSAIAGAVTGRAKASIHNALEQLVGAGVLVPIADLEAGELPR